MYKAIIFCFCCFSKPTIRQRYSRYFRSENIKVIYYKVPPFLVDMETRLSLKVSFGNSGNVIVEVYLWWRYSNFKLQFGFLKQGFEYGGPFFKLS